VIAVRLTSAPLDSPVEGGWCSRERAAAALTQIEGGGRSGARSQSDPRCHRALFWIVSLCDGVAFGPN
jgi:hypothetical protein